jgi:hypothetical protein
MEWCDDLICTLAGDDVGVARSVDESAIRRRSNQLAVWLATLTNRLRRLLVCVCVRVYRVAQGTPHPSNPWNDSDWGRAARDDHH